MDMDKDVIMIMVAEGILYSVVLVMVTPEFPRKRKTSLHHQKWSDTKVM